MDLRRRALGRGLGALIPATEPAAESRAADVQQGDEPTSIAIEAIAPNPFQPRDVFADEAIEELCASIREKGVLQPLLVRRVGDSYQLIAGERRFRAAQRAGLTRVPVTIRDVDDRESLELALIENLQRENLNPMEEARAYQRLADEFGLRHDEIAQRVGKNRSTVANAVRLLQLPAEVRQQIERGEISAGHARSLLGLAGAAQTEAARHVVQGKLSVRATERLVRQRQSAPAPDADQQAVEADLSRALGTRVRLRTAKGETGRIEIEYYSLAELNGLIDRLAGRT